MTERDSAVTIVTIDTVATIPRKSPHTHTHSHCTQLSQRTREEVDSTTVGSSEHDADRSFVRDNINLLVEWSGVESSRVVNML